METTVEKKDLVLWIVLSTTFDLFAITCLILHLSRKGIAQSVSEFPPLKNIRKTELQTK